MVAGALGLVLSLLFWSGGTGGEPWGRRMVGWGRAARDDDSEPPHRSPSRTMALLSAPQPGGFLTNLTGESGSR